MVAIGATAAQVNDISVVGDVQVERAFKIALYDESGAPLTGATVITVGPKGQFTAREYFPGVYMMRESQAVKQTIEVRHPSVGVATYQVGEDSGLALQVGSDGQGAAVATPFQPVVEEALAPPPANDTCAAAASLSVPGSVSGETATATYEPADCPLYTVYTSPSVWYYVIGNGNQLTFDTCTGTNYDSMLHAYCAGCTILNCVAGNDDSCGLQSQISFCSGNGVEYLIRVSGFSTATGNFTLTASNGAACSTPPAGCVPTGACCSPSNACTVQTEANCVASGGRYRCDGTPCAGFSGYQIVSGGGAFEDISATGTLSSITNSDDAAQTGIAIGFTFFHWNNPQTAIGISSNGIVCFSPYTSCSSLSNQAIPSPTDPDDLIAPWWDDLNPSANGDVYYQTLGTAPNRRFIAMWKNVPEYSNTGSNTFEAVLFESDRCIELRYQTVNACVGTDMTVGTENPGGSAALSIACSGIGTGNTVRRICPIGAPDPCLVNLPPQADAGGPYAAECAGPTTQVFLDGSNSRDCDNDPLVYSWTTSCTGTFDNAASATPTLTVNGATCNSSCDANLQVTAVGGSDTDTAAVTVRDTLPPMAQVDFSPVTPMAPQDVAQCSMPSRRMLQIDCGSVTDLCDPNPTAETLLIVNNRFVINSSCVQRTEVYALGCGDMFDVQLKPKVCPLKPPAPPARGTVNSAGVLQVEATELYAFVQASDNCGNVAALFIDPANQPSAACEQRLPDGTCCPVIQAAEPPKCSVPYCGQ